jgi:hypothetical protein
VNVVRRLLLVLVLCGFALTYLYQHFWSVRLTSRVAQLSKERQLLLEKREQLEVEVAELSSFARLESLWTARGRQSERRGVQVSVGSPVDTWSRSTAPAAPPAMNEAVLAEAGTR